MKRILTAAAAALLLAGCGQGGAGQDPGRQQEQERPKQEETTNSTPQAPANVEATMNEPVDLGPSVIEVVAAHKTAPNPAKGYDGKHYEGVFVAVQIDYTNQGKTPVEIPMELPLELEDSEGRRFFRDEEGYTATYTFARDELEYAVEMPTVSPGNTVHLAQAFQVAPGPVEGYTLRGSDFSCPQCYKGFEITIPGDLPRPTAPETAPATAVPSASASATASGQ